MTRRIREAALSADSTPTTPPADTRLVPLKGVPTSEREVIATMLEQLYEVYKPEGVGLWLKGRKRSLGGRSPIQAIRDGDVDKVAAQIDQLVTGAFS